LIYDAANQVLATYHYGGFTGFSMGSVHRAKNAHDFKLNPGEVNGKTKP
jgi:hypothetical protein